MASSRTVPKAVLRWIRAKVKGARMSDDVALMAHLIRRAAFGAPRDELEDYVSKGYDATVEELLDTEAQPDVELDLMARYLPEYAQLELT